MESKLEKIQESLEFFYQALYSQPQAPNETQIEAFLKTPRLTSAKKFAMWEISTANDN